MDPISQGALGALAAQTAGSGNQLGKAALIGALAAMAPDLDVLIQSSEDPLLGLEYHRHFTHSLLFAPFGGALCGLVLYAMLGPRWDLPMALVMGWSVLGFSTHGLLDVCTSYGTSLLWPVTDQRLSLDLVSIIDPLVTLPLLTAALVAWRRQRNGVAWLGLAWLAAYLALGGAQQWRAERGAAALAQSRGHTANHLRAMPSLGNLVIWRTVYEFGGEFYIDAVGAGADAMVFAGDRLRVADPRISWPAVPDGSQQRRDIERFARFTQGYMGFVPEGHGLEITDVRYGAAPNSLAPLWGLKLAPEALNDQHVQMLDPTGRTALSMDELWSMIQKTLE